MEVLCYRCDEKPKNGGYIVYDLGHESDGHFLCYQCADKRILEVGAKKIENIKDMVGVDDPSDLIKSLDSYLDHCYLIRDYIVDHRFYYSPKMKEVMIHITDQKGPESERESDEKGDFYVSFFFDLKRREPEVERRDYSWYLSKIQILLSQKLGKMVIYTDHDLVDEISVLAGDSDITVIGYDLEKCEDYRYMDRIKNITPLKNHNPKKDTPWYTILMWSKFSFMIHAKSTFPGYKRYVWIDLGICYIAKSPEKAVNLMPCDKIRLMMTRPTYSREISNEFFHWNNSRFAGGLIAVPGDLLDKFYSLWRQKVDFLVGKGLRPLEQDILTAIWIENESMFDVYLGDYEDIIRNFDGSFHSKVSLAKMCVDLYSNNRDYYGLQRIRSLMLENMHKGNFKVDSRELKILMGAN